MKRARRSSESSPSRAHISIRALVPNTLTTIALCAGLASMQFSLQEEWGWAIGCIFLAAIFDTLDGRFARLFGVSSRFGATLDSLADFLSFGIAPALLLFLWKVDEAEVLGLAAMVTYVVCAALRLARFTSAAPEQPVPDDRPRVFQGVPTPAASGIVLLPAMLAESRTLQLPAIHSGLVVTVLFVVGWLMISRIPAPSLGRVRIRRQNAPLVPIAVGLAVVLATKDPLLTLSFIVVLYVAAIPISMIVRHRRRPQGAERAAPRAQERGNGVVLHEPAGDE